MALRLRSIVFILVVIVLPWRLPGQTVDSFVADSWGQVQAAHKGAITALWYDIDPFIFRNTDGALIGVEYELMEAFGRYIRDQYHYDLKINWVNAGSFGQIYETISRTSKGGVFGWSFYSITPERQKEVRFTPAYMPDLNVLVTSNGLPLYTSEEPFIQQVTGMNGYTMAHTTMEEDMHALQEKASKLSISNAYDDYEVLRRIEAGNRCYGYVPLTIYIVALQKGIKVKRQHILATERPGFAGIYPKNSDWYPVVNEFFQSYECKRLVSRLLQQYLGKELGPIIMSGPGSSLDAQNNAGIELLTKEREIVSQRLVTAALQIQEERMFRNIIIASAVLMVLLVGLLYNRYRTKKQLSEKLQQQNTVIQSQHASISFMNRRLRMKVLQAQMNPHFFYNSLNDLQYFVNKGERKEALSHITRFSRFMRQMLEHANETSITLNQEISFLTQYLALEQIRFRRQFDYEVIASPGTIQNECTLPPLIMYHLVEDVLYKQVLSRDKGAWLKVVFDAEGEKITGTITYSPAMGKGKPLTSEYDAVPHAALLHERISLMNEELPGSIALRISTNYESGDVAFVQISFRSIAKNANNSVEILN